MGDGEEKRRGSLVVCPGNRLPVAPCRRGTDGIPAVLVRPDVARDLFLYIPYSICRLPQRLQKKFKQLLSRVLS